MHPVLGVVASIIKRRCWLGGDMKGSPGAWGSQPDHLSGKRVGWWGAQLARCSRVQDTTVNRERGCYCGDATVHKRNKELGGKIGRPGPRAAAAQRQLRRGAAERNKSAGAGSAAGEAAAGLGYGWASHCASSCGVAVRAARACLSLGLVRSRLRVGIGHLLRLQSRAGDGRWGVQWVQSGSETMLSSNREAPTSQA